MPRIQVTVSRKMDRALKRRSEETNVPVSALIREAIVEWAQKRGVSVQDDVSWGGVRYSELPQTDESESSGEVLAEAIR